MIHTCALGVILGRGERVIEPTINDLSDDEDDYLTRHVDELRKAWEDDGGIRAKFRGGSSTETSFRKVLVGTDEDFLGIAGEMVAALAATMRSSPRAKEDCVVALVTTPLSEGGLAEVVTFLKLDARIEAARLEQVKEGGIRLHVFQDLLPAPGEMQKGISWPDPRSPESDLILLDTNRGDAAQYFGNAFSLDISSRSQTTEKALAEALVGQLGPANARKAAALVAEGGRADDVVVKIKEAYPEFESSSRALGGSGGLPGTVRPGHIGDQKRSFFADGIELKVPLNKLDAVSAEADGAEFLTTIRTRTPLFPLEG